MQFITRDLMLDGEKLAFPGPGFVSMSPLIMSISISIRFEYLFLPPVMDDTFILLCKKHRAAEGCLCTKSVSVDDTPGVVDLFSFGILPIVATTPARIHIRAILNNLLMLSDPIITGLKLCM